MPEPTSEQLERRMDALARQYAKTHDTKIIAEAAACGAIEGACPI